MCCNSLQSSAEVGNASPAPDVRLLQPFFTIRGAIKPKVTLQAETVKVRVLHPAEVPGPFSSGLPRMDPRSAFRALLLPACVIICSNVLCPVGAFLYNNRYAG